MRLLEIAIAFALLIGFLMPIELAEYAECGTCGAHVTEWRYVSSGGAPFEICMDCYEIWEEEL